MDPADWQKMTGYFQLRGSGAVGQTAFGGSAWAMASGGWDTVTTNTTNIAGSELANHIIVDDPTTTWTARATLGAPVSEPDGVPGSHPLERILDGLEKSGPERIEKFL